MKNQEEISDTLEEFYNYEIPGYVIKAAKSSMTINIDSNNEKITMEDIINYYKYQAPNISSGYRTLAGFGGDWRPIDNLANEVLEWFKFQNIDNLKRMSKKMGLEPKF